MHSIHSHSPSFNPLPVSLTKSRLPLTQSTFHSLLILFPLPPPIPQPPPPRQSFLSLRINQHKRSLQRKIGFKGYCSHISRLSLSEYISKLFFFIYIFRIFRRFKKGFFILKCLALETTKPNLNAAAEKARIKAIF